MSSFLALGCSLASRWLSFESIRDRKAVSAFRAAGGAGEGGGELANGRGDCRTSGLVLCRLTVEDGELGVLFAEFVRRQFAGDRDLGWCGSRWRNEGGVGIDIVRLHHCESRGIESGCQERTCGRVALCGARNRIELDQNLPAVTLSFNDQVGFAARWSLELYWA